jgi:hypothetical protein
MASNTKKETDKAWRRGYNRALRRKVQIMLDVVAHDDAEVVLPTLKELSNVRDSPKEGKFYFGYMATKQDEYLVRVSAKFMRK